MSERFALQATHEWAGQVCAVPDMQAHFPPLTNPPTLLLSLGSPPAAKSALAQRRDDTPNAGWMWVKAISDEFCGEPRDLLAELPASL